MSAAPVAEVFAALGDPVRRLLVETIAGRGEATATELAAPLPVTRQAVDRHLRVLREAGVVEPARVGREVRWALRPDELERTRTWLADVAAQWDRRLLAVRTAAESPPLRTAPVESSTEGSGAAGPHRAG